MNLASGSERTMHRERARREERTMKSERAIEAESTIGLERSWLSRYLRRFAFTERNKRVARLREAVGKVSHTKRENHR